VKRSLAIALFLVSAAAYGTDFYASPTGASGNSGANCGAAIRPIDFLTNAARAVGGNRLFLCDGTYQGANFMISTGAYAGTAATCNWHTGTETGCIKVLAVNDGAVDIDGQGARRPFKLTTGANYWDIEGIDFHSSNVEVGQILGSHNILRRNMFWDAPDNQNVDTFLITGGSGVFFDPTNGVDNLIEDSGSFGYGRKSFEVFNSNGPTTLRRVWARPERSVNTGPKRGIQTAYHSRAMTIDNAIIRGGMSKMPASYVLQHNGANFTGGSCPGGVIGAGNICTYPGTVLLNGAEGWVGEDAYILAQDTSNNNSNSVIQGVLGLVDAAPYDTQSTSGSSAAAQGFFGMKQFGGNTGKDWFVYIAPGITDRITAAQPICFKLSASATCTSPTCSPAVTPLPSTLTNATCIAGGSTTPGDSVSSAWTVTNKLSGTSLSALGTGSLYTGASGGTAGAALRYRYVDGVLTGTPLWPWPMSARIKAATTKASTDGHGHAIEDIDTLRQSIFGLSPDETTPTPTSTSTPTSTPTPSRTPTRTWTPGGPTATPAPALPTPGCTAWYLCGDGWLHIRTDCGAASMNIFACGATATPTRTPTRTPTPSPTP
jgi:hypothetical protein